MPLAKIHVVECRYDETSTNSSSGKALSSHTVFCRHEPALRNFQSNGGERLQTTAFAEISAVCTYPEFRGRG
jgi:hypothetical protein